MHIPLSDETINTLLNDKSNRRARKQLITQVLAYAKQEKEETESLALWLQYTDKEKLLAHINSMHEGFNRFRLLCHLKDLEESNG